ncbi:MAG: plastocyanin/azurin family copper-binding protein [Aquihabitans sp.]
MRTNALLAVAALLFVASCGSGDEATDPKDATATTAPAEVDLSDKDFKDLTGETEVVIQARDNTFVPAYVEVTEGTKVIVRNVGRTEHNVIPSEDGALEPIEATELEPKDEVEVTFNHEGTYPYPYYCSLHGTPTAGMNGAVRVVGE